MAKDSDKASGKNSKAGGKNRPAPKKAPSAAVEGASATPSVISQPTGAGASYPATATPPPAAGPASSVSTTGAPGERGPGRAGGGSVGAPDRGGPGDLAGRVSEVVLVPLDLARRVLPQRSLPVYLGVAALVVAGVVEWPVAVAAGLGYAALRRWQPAR